MRLPLPPVEIAARAPIDCDVPSRAPDRWCRGGKEIRARAAADRKILANLDVSLVLSPQESFISAALDTAPLDSLAVIRFALGTDGHASDCVVERTTGETSLDTASCSLVMRHTIAGSCPSTWCNFGCGPGLHRSGGLGCKL